MNIIGLGSISALGKGVETIATLGSKEIPLPSVEFQETFLSDTRFYKGLIDTEIAKSGYQLAYTACVEALEKAVINKDKTALIIATGAGDTKDLEANPANQQSTYETAKKLAQALEIGGIFTTVSNACSSAGYALLLCEELLNDGYHENVLLCGFEAQSIATQATFKSLLVLDPESCRPFSEDRNGTVLGCGSATLLLSNKSTNKCYASVIGIASTCDAYHPTSPDPSAVQMQRCIEEAMQYAKLEADDINLFVPHATGTKINDEIEQRLLTNLFSKNFRSKNTLLLKKYIGHTGGASPAFSILAAALLLADARRANPSAQTFNNALINATAFGGNNNSIILTNKPLTQVS